MNPEDFLSSIIDPGLALLLEMGGPSITNMARRMMLSIALQESGPGLSARYQNSPAASPGPARGWWQFEQGGGTAGVLQHSASRALALLACERFCVVNSPAAVWRALEGHDMLAVCFARLLLWTDPKPLPDNAASGWEYYLRNWRPGKPHAQVWPGHWQTAMKAVEGLETV
jgi:hypothetical protein